jgi:hypothetical protein
MSIQFITDSSGKNTGVFIPIEQWKKMKSKFRDLENEEIDIPEWQKLELDKRLENYSTNPEDVLDAKDVLDDIDNEL